MYRRSGFLCIVATSIVYKNLTIYLGIVPILGHFDNRTFYLTINFMVFATIQA